VDTKTSAPPQGPHSAAGMPSPTNADRQRLALEPGPPRIRYSARVRAYSFLGMPIGVVSINKDGEILCRTFYAALQVAGAPLPRGSLALPAGGRPVGWRERRPPAGVPSRFTAARS
jgi:hypothetical protein